jgi:hypothetical protein
MIDRFVNVAKIRRLEGGNVTLFLRDEKASLHNFGVPSLLKNRIQAISGAGVTFRYSEQGPEGLLKREGVRGTEGWRQSS